MRLLFWKLALLEHEHNCKFVLPQESNEICFNERIELLSNIFFDKNTLSKHSNGVLEYYDKQRKDFIIYAGTINTMGENFKFEELRFELFKCRIFVKGLTGSEDEGIRARILSKLEEANKNIIYGLWQKGTVLFLQELFAPFDVWNVIHIVCEIHAINTYFAPLYHQRSKCLTERFVNTFKRALWNARDKLDNEKTLPNTLRAYRIMPTVREAARRVNC